MKARSQRSSINKKSASVVGYASGGSQGWSLRVAVGVVVAAMIVAVGFVVAHHKTTSIPTSAPLIPTSVSPDGTIRIGSADAKAVVKVIEDFQCPHCREFETQSAATLATLAEQGVAIDYQPIAILDRASSTDYSTRAVNAAYCVADADRSKWVAWHSAAFQAQPIEGGVGLSDEQLIAIARTVGVTGDDVAGCISSEKFLAFATSTTKELLASGVSHTPTIMVNGQEIAVPTPDAIEAAVVAVK
ncbi:MAG: DsbA family protein [Nocardiaceae bacterium]|nr:DsbA family protein [Nocardiaceae bacterium]